MDELWHLPRLRRLCGCEPPPTEGEAADAAEVGDRHGDRDEAHRAVQADEGGVL